MLEEWVYPQPDRQRGAPCASMLHGGRSNTSAREHLVASAFSHTFVALALGTASSQGVMPGRVWVLSVLCAVLPAADVLGLALRSQYVDMFQPAPALPQ